MSSIFGFLKNIYIRFMVWLGADPPAGYEHLLPKEQRPAAKKPLVPPKPAPKPLPKPEPVAEAAPPTEPEPLIVEETPPPAPPKPLESIPNKDLAWLEVKEEAPVAEETEEAEQIETIVSPPVVSVIDELEPTVPTVAVVPPEPVEVEEEAEVEEAALYRYTVQRGDTLTSIAKHFNTTLLQIIDVNQLEDPNRIFVGQKLIIPGILGEVVPPPIQPVVAPRPKIEPLVQAGTVQAVYLSYFAVGHQDTRQKILNLLDTTTLNALVIDVKSDFGLISYPTNNVMAQEIEANRPAAKDFAAFIAQLKEQGVYLIARMVVFRDDPLAKNRPDLAVKTKSGTLWQNSEGGYWVDPFQTTVWDYNIQLAKEAAQMGFDEIQFDYLRFPTESQAGAPQFSKTITKENRVAAISGFLSAARGQIKPWGVKLSARTFGYTCWRVDDTQIGQTIEQMAEYLDVLCPMLYPSTFHKGIPGFKLAVAHPYEVVHQSAQRAVERVSLSGCQVRPWIQDFQDYRFDYRTYGKEEIQAQIKGCFDAGSTGYMAWNPNAHYTSNAYAPR